MPPNDDIGARARELREAFDGAFARAAQEEVGAWSQFLAVRVGERVGAVRVEDLMSIHSEEFVLRVPSEARAVLGLANLRGVVVAVYDLAVLLSANEAARRTEGACRYLLRCKDAPVVFAVDEIIAYARLPGDVQASQDAQEVVRGFDARIVGSEVLPVIPVPHLLREIVS